MPKKRTSRIYQKRGRYYADFRDYAEVGGRKEALRAPQQRTATTDVQEAEFLARRRLEQLERLRASGPHVLADGRDLTRLADLVDYHLEQMAENSDVSNSWLGTVELHLDRALDFLGAAIPASDVTPLRVSEYARHLHTVRTNRREPDRSLGVLGPGSRRQHLSSLSKLFQRAIMLGILPQAQNPVASLMEMPRAPRKEAAWLEVHDAALLLHVASLYRSRNASFALRCIYPLVATFLLTGGRAAEVLGLLITDINFERKTVKFRRHDHRSLKTSTSDRPVPLWPQLEEILRDYLAGPDAPSGPLLFPSSRGTGGEMITDIRKILDELAARMAWAGDPLRTKCFRHTYCAARLQTTDQGFPVAKWTVSRELGHGSSQMVEQVYGHLGRIRYRGEVVEYRVDHVEDELGERLAAAEKRSEERNQAPVVNLPNRVAPEVEQAALEFARAQPEWGTTRAVRALNAAGVQISRSGLGWVWLRHGLETVEKRRRLANG